MSAFGTISTVRGSPPIAPVDVEENDSPADAATPPSALARARLAYQAGRAGTSKKGVVFLELRDATHSVLLELPRTPALDDA